MESDNEGDRNGGKIAIPTANHKATLWLRPSGQGQALLWPAGYRKLTEFRIHLLIRVLEIEEANRSDEIRWIDDRAKKFKDRDYEGPGPADDAFWVEETRELVEHLAIIGLYRTVELMTKQILSHVYGRESKRLRRCSVWRNFECLLLNDYGVALRNIAGSTSIDELRLLSNCIKHNGIVDEKLAKYPGWAKGTFIKETRSHFQRFGSVVPSYVEDLAKKLNSYLVQYLPAPRPPSSEDLGLLEN